MPYTKPDDRERVNLAISVNPEFHLEDWTAGDLTYGFTRLAWHWLKSKKVCYLNCALVIGCLVCTILELYRRVVAPYENGKIAENGDVYL